MVAGQIKVIRELCLNHHFGKLDCRRCAESCPHGVFATDRQEAGPDCTNCGLCLGVCPVGAVAGELYSPAGLEALFRRDAGQAGLVCRRQQEQSPWPCLGFLDGRLLLALAVCWAADNRPVILDDSACRACDPQVAEHLAAVVGKTNGLLAEAGLPAIVSGKVVYDYRERSVTRRAFFSQLLGLAGETLREAVAASNGTCEPLPRREWFDRHVTAQVLGEGLACGLFSTPAIRAEVCNACGLCVKHCPQGALRTVDYGTALEFCHTPLACIGCGVCAAYCPQGAITLTAAAVTDKHTIARVDFPRCELCGQVFQPTGGQTACIECLFRREQ